MEEAGCGIIIGSKILEAQEWRKEHSCYQISHVYTATVKGKPQPPAFTEYEKENKFELLWASLEDILQKFSEPVTKPYPDYQSQFISVRDSMALMVYAKLYCL